MNLERVEPFKKSSFQVSSNSNSKNLSKELIQDKNTSGDRMFDAVLFITAK